MPSVPLHFYALGLGSNRPVRGGENPEALVERICALLDEEPSRLVARSPVIRTAPVGPSLRRYANAAAIVETALTPPDMLRHLKQIESDFGRRRGQRWSARPIDLDILLWDGGAWADSALIIPHRLMRERDFVLSPLARIAPGWRDPMSGLTVRHLLARLQKPCPEAKAG